jgi:hypothetical protein
MRPILAAVASVLAVSAAPALAQPLTTAFTFQGELDDGATPASGTYDFRFTLFDAATGGSQVGPQLCSDNLAVTAGRVAVQLDFGLQFTGSQRFLEVQVRHDTGLGCSNATGFATLSPRQNLTASPNAIYSSGAGSAASALNATQLGGQSPAFYTDAANLAGMLPSATLVGSYSSTLSFTNTSNTYAGSGAALTGLNASSLASGTLDPARLPLPLTLTGVNTTALVQAINTSTTDYAAGFLGRNSAASGATVGVLGQSDSPGGNGLYGLATPTTGQAWGVYGLTNSAAGLGGYFTGPGDALWAITSGVGYSCVVGIHEGSANGVGLYGQTNGTTGAGVFGRVYSSTGSTLGGQFTSYSSAGTGVGAYALSTTGGTIGVYGESDSSAGIAMSAYDPSTTGSTIGLQARVDSTSGLAVYGFAPASSGSTIAGKFVSVSPTGTGVQVSGGTYGGQFSAGTTAVSGSSFNSGVGSGGYGVYGEASSDTGAGVFGVGYSTVGTGVWGRATAGSGTNYAGYFENFSTNGRGVYGHALATTGQTYGVLGQATPNGWAVYAQGDMGASGLKPFRIDHPSDPQNKYLLHYCTESPEALNFYSGNVTLNEQGAATIDLPSYFASINKDPRYSLTAIGAPMPLLHVAQEIDAQALTAGNAANPGDAIPACAFRIEGGAPAGKVSWRVEALRSDRWVQRNGTPVEVDKAGPEKGTYQHPELYGQPPQTDLSYRPSTPLPVPPPISAVPAAAPRERYDPPAPQPMRDPRRPQ